MFIIMKHPRPHETFWDSSSQEEIPFVGKYHSVLRKRKNLP